jgi:hypothetical protein
MRLKMSGLLMKFGNTLGRKIHVIRKWQAKLKKIAIKGYMLT